jgi:hypothetical protein
VAHEDRVGALGGQVAAVLRGAGLEDHRLALGRAGDVQRALHRQELALVTQGVQLVGIEEHAAGLVVDQGVVFPAVPETLDDVQILGRQAVAGVVRQMLGLAEVLGRAFQPGGDDVPAGAAAADVVQRGELAGHVEGLGIGDAERGHQADVLGHRGQGRQDGDRLEAVQIVRAGLGVDRQAVGDEQEVELALLGQLGGAAVVLEIGAGAGLGVGMTPVGPGAPRALDHVAELQLSALRHDGLRCKCFGGMTVIGCWCGNGVRSIDL